MTVGEPASRYVAMSDGVRLAVSSWVPPGDPVPAVLVATEYWRYPASPALRGPHRLRAEVFNRRGYAVVAYDIRGSGASFGVRSGVFTPRQHRDLAEIVDWVIAQHWSDGSVVADGVSNPGTMGEFLIATGHPAVRGVSLRFSDIDLYGDVFFPGGMVTAGLTQAWQRHMVVLDGLGSQRADGSGPAGAEPDPVLDGPARVDDDHDGALLRAAVAEHAGNLDVHQAAAAIAFRDDPFGPEGRSLDQVSTGALHFPEETRRVPELVVASWSDAATARGALRRFAADPTRPTEVVIGPWGHGALAPGDPYRDPAGEPESLTRQLEHVADFFDRCRSGMSIGRALRCYVLGAGAWVDLDGWPVPDREYRDLALADADLLGPPGWPGRAGDQEVVDVPAEGTTGTSSRWLTQRGGGAVDYGDRRAADRSLLVHEWPATPTPVAIVGVAQALLTVSAATADAQLLVYLEDLGPDGTVRMITEGGLRLLHRRGRDVDPDLSPTQSFRRVDADAAVPDREAVTVDLLPTAALLRVGHRLRLAVAGADADNFAGGPPGARLRLHIGQGLLRLPVSRSTAAAVAGDGSPQAPR